MNGRLHHLLLMTAALQLAHVATYAQQSVIVRSSVKPSDVFVGQKAIVTVEVLTTTFFTQQPDVRIPKVGAIAMLSDPISKGPMSEGTGDDALSGVSFEYVVFALRDGTIDIPPFSITTFQRDDGKPVESHPVMTPVQLNVTLPDAAIDLTSLICTSDFQIEDKWDPPLAAGKTIHVGDAFTRTVTMRAPDLLGMILPPLPDFDQPGLRAYEKDPSVKDEMNRGDLIATRIETITFQCEKPGYYELPMVEIPWWDVQNKELKRATLQPMTFDVAPNPDEPSNVPPSVRPSRVYIVWYWLAALAIVLSSVWIYLRRPSQLHGPSERQLFLAVERACRQSSAKDTYQAIVAWANGLEDTPPNASLLDLFDVQGSHLRDAVVILECAVVKQDANWTAGDLVRELRAWRKQHLRRVMYREEKLPALNPIDHC